MREYSSKIALIKNSRGIYSIDTSIGCKSGMENNKGGCYNDCYAAKSAKRYGYNFGKTVLRDFEDIYHQREILTQIKSVKLDFIRIGTSGDPSEDWNHTCKIIKVLAKSNKEIVVITKHWTNLTKKQLEFFNKINICINTSVSALDKPELLNNALKQYKRLKPYCKSILRIVSADFNKENIDGKKYSDIQHDLFKNEDTLDTVLRVNKNNPLVKNGIINVKESKFLGKKALISKFNKKTYFGKCANCLEMCGVRIKNENHKYTNKRPLVKQLTII